MNIVDRIKRYIFFNILLIGLLFSVVLLEILSIIYLLLSVFFDISPSIILISFLPLVVSPIILYSPLFPYIGEYLYPSLKNHFLLLYKNKQIDRKWIERGREYLRINFSPLSDALLSLYGRVLVSILFLELLLIIISPLAKYTCKGGIFILPFPKYFSEDTLGFELKTFNTQSFFVKTNGIKKGDTVYIASFEGDTVFTFYISNFKYHYKITRPVAGKVKVRSVKVEVFPPSYTGLKPYLWKGDSILIGSRLKITLFLSGPAEKVVSKRIEFAPDGTRNIFSTSVVLRSTIVDTIIIENDFFSSYYYLYIPSVKDKNPLITIEYPSKYHEISPSLKQLVVYNIYDDYGISSVEGVLTLHNNIKHVNIPDTTSFILDLSDMFMFPGDTSCFFIRCKDLAGNLGISDTINLVMPSVNEMVDAISGFVNDKIDMTDRILERINNIAEEWAKMKMEGEEFSEERRKELIRETEELIKDIKEVKNRIENEMKEIVDNPYLVEDEELVKKIETLMKLENEVNDILKELPMISKNNNFRIKDPLSWKDELSQRIEMTKNVLAHLKKKIYLDRLKSSLNSAQKSIKRFMKTRNIEDVNDAIGNIEKSLNLADSLNMENIAGELNKALEKMRKINENRSDEKNKSFARKASSHIENAQRMLSKETEDIKTPMLFAFTTLLSYSWSIEKDDIKGWIKFFDRAEYTINYYYNKGPSDPMLFIMTFIKVLNLKDELHTFKNMVNNHQYGLIQREKEIVYSIISDIVYLIMMSEGPASNQGGGNSSMISMAQEQISLMRQTASGSISMDEIMRGEEKLLSQLKSMMENGEGGKEIGDIGKEIEDLINEMKGKEDSEVLRRNIVKKQRDIAKHLLKSAMARYKKGKRYEFEVERDKMYEYRENGKIIFNWKDEMIENYRKEKVEGIEDYQRRFIEKWQ